MTNENAPTAFDTLLTTLKFSNADLVKASTEQLTFKMVQKARKGAPLSAKAQQKIINVLIKLKPGMNFKHRVLFTLKKDEALDVDGE